MELIFRLHLLVLGEASMATRSKRKAAPTSFIPLEPELEPIPETPPPRRRRRRGQALASPPSPLSSTTPGRPSEPIGQLIAATQAQPSVPVTSPSEVNRTTLSSSAFEDIADIVVQKLRATGNVISTATATATVLPDHSSDRMPALPLPVPATTDLSVTGFDSLNSGSVNSDDCALMKF